MCEVLLRKVKIRVDEILEKRSKAEEKESEMQKNISKNKEHNINTHYCSKCGHLVGKDALEKAENRIEELKSIIECLEKRLCKSINEKYNKEDLDISIISEN